MPNSAPPPLVEDIENYDRAPISNAVQMLGMQRNNESAIQKEARGIIERQTNQLQHLVCENILRK